MLTLFAFAGAQQPDNNTQTIRSSRWLTRLASTLGIMSQSQPGGAIKLDKNPAERPPGATATSGGSVYRPRAQILRPVSGGSQRQVARHAADRSGVGSEDRSSGTESSEATNAKVAGPMDQCRRLRDVRVRHRLRPASASMVSAWGSLDSSLAVILRT